MRKSRGGGKCVRKGLLNTYLPCCARACPQWLDSGSLCQAGVLRSKCAGADVAYVEAGLAALVWVCVRKPNRLVLRRCWARRARAQAAGERGIMWMDYPQVFAHPGLILHAFAGAKLAAHARTTGWQFWEFRLSNARKSL